MKLFTFGRCGDRLGSELLPEDLLVGGLVLGVLGGLFLAGLSGGQRGTSGCCIHGAGRLCVSLLQCLCYECECRVVDRSKRESLCQ